MRIHCELSLSHPRVYYYLRQPDILQQFLATCRAPDSASGGTRAQLPWDLLIVDEAHNLLPSPFGEDNQLVKALSEIAIGPTVVPPFLNAQARAKVTFPWERLDGRLFRLAQTTCC